MQGHAALEDALATAPSSPTRRLCSGQDVDVGCDDDTRGIHFFFSAPASPVHYILRSPPASSSSSASAHNADGDGCAAAAGDFEFACTRPRVAGTGIGMSSAEDLFLSGRIRVGGLSPIRQETDHGGDEDGQDERGGHSPRPRRARSASPPRTPRFAENGTAETRPDSFASSSSSSSSSSSGKTIRRRISLRDLLGRSGSDSSAGPAAAAAAAISSGAEAERSSFWLPSIWPSRTKKAPLLPCPCPAAPPHPGRRSTSSVRAAPGGGGHGRQREGAPPRRTTSLPYRQGLVLGCLGLGARSYGLAKSMHPLSTR